MDVGTQPIFHEPDRRSRDDLHDALIAAATADVGDADETETTSPPLRRILIATDAAALTLGWLAAVVTLVLLGGDPALLTWTTDGLVVVVGGGLMLSANGLYRRRICSVRSAEIARLGRATILLVGGALLLLTGTGASVENSAAAAVAAGITWFGLLVVERGVLREWIQVRRSTGDFRAPVVVLAGNAAATQRTAGFLDDNPVLGFEVVGIAGSSAVADTDAAATGTHERFTRVSDRAELVRSARLWAATGVVLDAASLTGDELNLAVRELSSANLHVHISSGLQGIDPRRISVAGMVDETFLHVAPPGLSRPQVVVKRVVDVALSAAAMLVAAPLLALCGLVVWAYDRGPVLYRQERVGREGERFKVYKLRTMVVDADQRLEELLEGNGRGGPLFKLTRDPRVTPFGRFLRASSIDELPQLFNVLEGTMSLVGPRPALPEEVAQFDDWLTARLTVKPGVTGLWQVEARDLASFDLYRRYDLLYVQNWSVGLDLSIIARTIAVVAMRTLRALIPTRLRRSAEVLE